VEGGRGGGGTDCASSSDFEKTEAGEGRGAGDDVGSYPADDHHLGWVGRDEFRRHVGDSVVSWEDRIATRRGGEGPSYGEAVYLQAGLERI